MVHDLYKWNISDEKAFDMIHDLLISIINEKPNKYIQFQELITLLNQRGKKYKIHVCKRHNCLTKYIKIKYGGVHNFINSYSLYEIRKNQNKEYVYLLNNDKQYLYKKLINDNEWELV